MTSFYFIILKTQFQTFVTKTSMTNKNVEINRVSSISGQIIPLASSTSHSLSPIPAGNLKGKQ